MNIEAHIEKKNLPTILHQFLSAIPDGMNETETATEIFLDLSKAFGIPLDMLDRLVFHGDAINLNKSY